MDVKNALVYWFYTHKLCGGRGGGRMKEKRHLQVSVHSYRVNTTQLLIYNNKSHRLYTMTSAISLNQVIH